VGKLPNQLDDMFKETGQLIHESNQTIADVNHKLEQLSPLFYVVGDVGKVTHKFSSSLVDFTQSLQERRKRHNRSEEHTSELQSRFDLVCRLLLEKKNNE